jgi:hypothetical protein
MKGMDEKKVAICSTNTNRTDQTKDFEMKYSIVNTPLDWQITKWRQSVPYFLAPSVLFFSLN